MNDLLDILSPDDQELVIAELLNAVVNGTWTKNLKTGLIDVDGHVNCYNMNLTQLLVKFGKVNGNFSCSYNQLISLEGSPKSVGGEFSCFDSQLKSLEGAPKSVRMSFSCDGNAAQFTEEDVLEVSKVKGGVIVYYYNVS